MSINARVVELDGSGNGKITVAPTFYCGSKGATSVSSEDGQGLGTAFLTRGSAIACEGAIDVQGSPNTEAVLYFDFD